MLGKRIKTIKIISLFFRPNRKGNQNNQNKEFTRGRNKTCLRPLGCATLCTYPCSIRNQRTTQLPHYLTIALSHHPTNSLPNHPCLLPPLPISPPASTVPSSSRGSRLRLRNRRQQHLPPSAYPNSSSRTNPSPMSSAVQYAREHSISRRYPSQRSRRRHPAQRAACFISTKRMHSVSVDPPFAPPPSVPAPAGKKSFPLAASTGFAPIVGSSTDVGAVGYLLGRWSRTPCP